MKIKQTPFFDPLCKVIEILIVELRLLHSSFAKIVMAFDAIAVVTNPIAVRDLRTMKISLKKSNLLYDVQKRVVQLINC